MIYWILLLPTRKLTVVLRSYGNLLSVLFTINLTSILFIKFSQPYSLYPLSYFLYPILFILFSLSYALTIFSLLFSLLLSRLFSLLLSPLFSLLSISFLLSTFMSYYQYPLNHLLSYIPSHAVHTSVISISSHIYTLLLHKQYSQRHT